MDVYLDGLLDELVPAEPIEGWDDVLRRARRSRRRYTALVAAVAAAAALSAGGLAIADSSDSFGPLHGVKLVVTPVTVAGANGSLSTCDLIGKSAGQASARLSASGIAIEWRFMHWGTVTAPTAPGAPVAVTGGRSDVVSSVPADSIVWDVSPDGRAKALVSVQAPHDPNAPTISLANCTN